MRIASVGRAFPEHYYSQDELLTALREVWGQQHHNPERLERLHKNVLVSGRHLALPIDEYRGLADFGAANDAWIRVAQQIGAAAVDDALQRAGLDAGQVDALLTVTVTGVATPSLDARLMNRLPFRSDLARLPVFGLGCVAGAAGISRAADLVRGRPNAVAVLLSVELCSLTVQQKDLSIPNLIATGLFGDGAAAVVVVGDGVDLPASPSVSPSADGVDTHEPGPRIVATRSVFYRDTEGVMGWDIQSSGFQIILSATVPEMVSNHLVGDVDRFLADYDLERGDIATWICHPGGPKVLTAMQEGLELPDGALDVTWRSLREVGNLSSTSVLLVLRETLDNHRPPAGSYGVLLAMGPGFCSELVLLRF